MDKKALRKELEQALVKSIEETLNKRNAIAGKQIRKKVEEASKVIAKKFYKAIKALNDNKPAPAKAPVKKSSSSKAITTAKPKAKPTLKKKK